MLGKFEWRQVLRKEQDLDSHWPMVGGQLGILAAPLLLVRGALGTAARIAAAAATDHWCPALGGRSCRQDRRESGQFDQHWSYSGRAAGTILPLMTTA